MGDPGASIAKAIDYLRPARSAMRRGGAAGSALEPTADLERIHRDKLSSLNGLGASACEGVAIARGDVAGTARRAGGAAPDARLRKSGVSGASGAGGLCAAVASPRSRTAQGKLMDADQVAAGSRKAQLRSRRAARWAPDDVGVAGLKELEGAVGRLVARLMRRRCPWAIISAMCCARRR